MEAQSPPPQEPSLDYYHSNVDTSRPFRSVKEAVAIFGERILVGEIYSCTPNNQIITSSWPPPPDDNNNEVVEEANANDDHNKKETETETVSAVVALDTLKRLELELKDTKAELKLLKDREQETEVALASLNAQLHKNMSRLAQAEAAAANAQLVVATTRSTATPNSSSSSAPPPPTSTSSALINVAKDQQNKELQEDMAMIRRRKELMKSMQKNTTLAQILSLENDAFFANSNKKRNQFQNQFTKKKPIVPLVADLFCFRKKNTSSFSSNPQLLYASSQFYHL